MRWIPALLLLLLTGAPAVAGPPEPEAPPERVSAALSEAVRMLGSSAERVRVEATQGRRHGKDRPRR